MEVATVWAAVLVALEAALRVVPVDWVSLVVAIPAASTKWVTLAVVSDNRVASVVPISLASEQAATGLHLVRVAEPRPDS